MFHNGFYGPVQSIFFFRKFVFGIRGFENGIDTAAGTGMKRFCALEFILNV